MTQAKKTPRLAALLLAWLLAGNAFARCPSDCITNDQLREIAEIIQGGSSATAIQTALMNWSLTNIPMNPANYEHQQFMRIYNSIGAGPLAAVFDSLSPLPSP